MFHPFNYVLCGNLIITERWALGSFYLIFEFTPLYGLYLPKLLKGCHIGLFRLIYDDSAQSGVPTGENHSIFGRGMSDFLLYAHLVNNPGNLFTDTKIYSSIPNVNIVPIHT